jgi:hypothetical protein
MNELTPFDMEYYARPRSKEDEKTLAEHGWRELTKQEVDEFMKCRKISPTGVSDYQLLCKELESSKATLRFYKGEGVCVYVKTEGEEVYMPLDDGDERLLATLQCLLGNLEHKRKHGPTEGFKANNR